MPPPVIFDVTKLDPTKVIYGREEIDKVIPQRFEMSQLSAIIYEEPDLMVGYLDVTGDEFWVRGHIPGRPLMPGVLMIECAAQICAFNAMKRNPEMGFIGFARCTDVIFRGTVTPPSRLFMAVQMVERNRRRAVGKAQGICNGAMVFEAVITGMSV
jgi:3-hydroxyacyl-[acyl-carrier-protein] dehydratase